MNYSYGNQKTLRTVKQGKVSLVLTGSSAISRGFRVIIGFRIRNTCGLGVKDGFRVCILCSSS